MADDRLEYYAKDRKTWRKWLEKNGATESKVWLIFYKKGSAQTSVNYVDATEEALCFGWIDGKAMSRDEHSYFISFSKRKPHGTWSKINKERIERMIKEKLMTKAGMDVIDAAKKNGSWETLDDISEGILPADLIKALSKNKKALKNFNAFPPSSRKMILQWIQSAKRHETRDKRLQETVEKAAENIRAK